MDDNEVTVWARRMMHWHSATLVELRDAQKKVPLEQREAARLLLNLRMVQPDLFGKL